MDAALVSRIEAHRAVIDRIGQELSVSPHLLRGIIAAESSGYANTGAGGTGYKGLMQCEPTVDQLTPEVSVRCGAKKYGAFATSMRTFFRDTLKRDFGALPEDDQIRIVMAAYNAGPGSVKRAMQFALRAGDVNQWLSSEHYVRALLSTGAYNPVESVLNWGITTRRLTTDTLASDLSRLSGKPLAELRATYAPGGKWDPNRLAKALRPLLFTEKTKLTNDGSATLSALRSQATASLLCAAEFKQAHTSGYLDKVVRYKRHFAGK